jgi:hypothetical protein
MAAKSVLAYKNEAGVGEAQDDSQLDAFSLWTRVLVCPIVVPCLFCFAICFGVDPEANAQVAPTSTINTHSDGGGGGDREEEPELTPLEALFARLCPCCIDNEDSTHRHIAHVHRSLQGQHHGQDRKPPSALPAGSIIANSRRTLANRNANSNGGLMRPSSFDREKAIAALAFELGTAFARTDKFELLVAGSWQNNTFIPTGEEKDPLLRADSEDTKDGADDEDDNSKSTGRRKGSIDGKDAPKFLDSNSKTPSVVSSLLKKLGFSSKSLDADNSSGAASPKDKDSKQDNKTDSRPDSTPDRKPNSKSDSKASDGKPDKKMDITSSLAALSPDSVVGKSTAASSSASLEYAPLSTVAGLTMGSSIVESKYTPREHKSSKYGPGDGDTPPAAVSGSRDTTATVHAAAVLPIDLAKANASPSSSPIASSRASAFYSASSVAASRRGSSGTSSLIGSSSIDNAADANDPAVIPLAPILSLNMPLESDKGTSGIMGSAPAAQMSVVARSNAVTRMILGDAVSPVSQLDSKPARHSVIQVADSSGTHIGLVGTTHHDAVMEFNSTEAVLNTVAADVNNFDVHGPIVVGKANEFGQSLFPRASAVPIKHLAPVSGPTIGAVNNKPKLYYRHHRGGSSFSYIDNVSAGGSLISGFDDDVSTSLQAWNVTL